MEGLPVLTGIQPAELCRLGATLSLANHVIHDPDHLHKQLVGQQVHTSRDLDRLSELDICAKQWMKQKWNADYLKSTSRVCAFIPRVSSRPLGMSLPRTSWVRLNRQQTGVGCFHLSMYKWDLAPSPNCECVATEQTADHVISSCLLHHVPRGKRGLQVLDDAA